MNNFRFGNVNLGAQLLSAMWRQECWLALCRTTPHKNEKWSFLCRTSDLQSATLPYPPTQKWGWDLKVYHLLSSSVSECVNDQRVISQTSKKMFIFTCVNGPFLKLWHYFYCPRNVFSLSVHGGYPWSCLLQTGQGVPLPRTGYAACVRLTVTRGGGGGFLVCNSFGKGSDYCTRCMSFSGNQVLLQKATASPY